MQKRHVLYAGSYAFPKGGADDIIQSTDWIDSARMTFDQMRENSSAFDWAQIYDTNESKIVFRWVKTDGAWMAGT